MTVRSVTVRYAADVTSLISGLDRAAKANDKVAGSSDKAGKRVDSMAAAGLGLTLAMGFAIAKFAEFDAQMSAVAAATGESKDGLDALRDAAIKAGADTQFSATEAAKAITELSKAGVEATDILGGGLTGALNLAAAGQLDVAEAAELAATAMTQFNLQGKDVTHVADLLAAGAGKAQGSVHDMGAALKQSGLVASQVGLSIEETTAGLTAFASAGLIGSDAGTSFKSMLQRLTPQSAEAADLMKKLGFSAFDSQGNFKGLEAVAGNLKDSLKDLTPEQRNAALATIFGSDAVRAASVLYKQGAEGIHQWTDAVNQQGFAAQQAARLTDNLKGDLERFQGALDTAFIQTGSGANNVLREIVQTGESLVNTIAKIPGPVLLGATAFTTLALVGPKIGSLAKVVTGPLLSGMTRFREEAALQAISATTVSTALDSAGESAAKGSTKFQRASGTMAAASQGFKAAASGVVGLLGGPWGIALTAATIGVTAFATAQANAESAAKEFSDTLDQQTGILTESSRTFIASKISDDISGEDLKKLQSYGINLADAAQAAQEGGPKMQAYLEMLRSRANTEDASAVFSALASSVENTNEVVERGKLRWQETTGILNDTADSASAADRKISGLGGTVDTYTQSAKDGKTATGDMDGALGDIQISAEDAKTALDNLSNSLEGLGGGQRALRAAQRQLATDLEDLGKAGKQDEKGTKTQAQRKREYQEALDRVAGSTATLLKRQADEKVSVGTLKNTYDTQREAVEKSLKSHGFHGKALEAEADKILGTRDDFNLLLVEYAKNPEVIASEITTPGLPESKKAVEGYWTVINGVPTFVETKFDANTADASKSVKGLAAAIAAIDDKTVTITTIFKNFGFQASLEAIQARRRPDVFFGVAKGGLYTAYAGGGMDVANAHVPEIAPAGSYRVWAEPETKGEAYIPFANDWRRPRAKAIASESVRRLGGSVSWYAGGGSSQMSGSSWAMSQGSGIDYNQMAKAFARLQIPNLHIVSGEDAKMAAKVGIREFVYQRDNG